MLESKSAQASASNGLIFQSDNQGHLWVTEKRYTNTANTAAGTQDYNFIKYRNGRYEIDGYCTYAGTAVSTGSMVASAEQANYLIAYDMTQARFDASKPKIYFTMGQGYAKISCQNDVLTRTDEALTADLAITATKLGTSRGSTMTVGSSAQPVYFSNGVPVACNFYIA